ncbi:hypothetical protein TNCV_3633561 [Trichonephila clavipes]|nr:hypothetical protein TNCV_3633561 [Trichonephila clavipes]
MSSAGYSSSPLHCSRWSLIHSGMATEWAGFVSTQTKPVEAYCQKAMSGRDFRFSQLGVLFGSFIAGDPRIIWTHCIDAVQPYEMRSAILVRHLIVLRQSVGVLLPAAEITSWESMKKTTCAGARPAVSNCIVTSQTSKTVAGGVLSRGQ